ncbi:MAG: hypothetical protein F6K23_35990 [Okeania sp. SIO2C9]|uniref:hypothetical protein n=1 Tax=Okeania sp. SIO2C9 TaxID=2607791 RepID=UPI0013C167AC|nr:hypothetical protein [Okeania sp. SIO2C9]NEQ77940.1 hypothetical protein [Okeania sp. SIO2C9]
MTDWSHRRVAVRPDQLPFLKRIAAQLETNNLSTVVNYLLDDYKIIKQQPTILPSVVNENQSSTQTDDDEFEIDLSSSNFAE